MLETAAKPHLIVVLLGLSLLSVAGLSGCSPEDPAQDLTVAETPAVAEEPPPLPSGPPPLPTEVARVEVLALDGVILTADDVYRAVRRRSMLRGTPIAQIVPEGWTHDPLFLIDVATSIFQDRALLAEGERLGLLPSGAQIEAAWSEHEDLALYRRDDEADTDDVLRTLFDLEREDLYEMLRLEWAYEQWLGQVFEHMVETRLEEEFYFRRRTVTVRMIRVPNLPSDEAIEALLEAPPTPSWLSDQYQPRLPNLRLPGTVDIRIVGAATRARIDRLSQEAAEGADLVEMSTTRSEHPAAERGGLVLQVIPAQRPSAFELEVGQLSEVETDRHGFSFFRVEARRAGETMPLDEALGRRIAREYLADTVAQPAPLGRARAVAAWLAVSDEAAVADLVRQHLMREQVLGPLRYEADGMVAGVGVSQTLRDALFALTPDSPVTEPVLFDGDIFVGALIERSDPTPEDFAAQRADFLVEFEQLIRATAWDGFWQQHVAERSLEILLPDAFFDDDKSR